MAHVNYRQGFDIRRRSEAVVNKTGGLLEDMQDVLSIRVDLFKLNPSKQQRTRLERQKKRLGRGFVFNAWIDAVHEGRFSLHDFLDLLEKTEKPRKAA